MTYKHLCAHEACLQVDDPTVNGLARKVHILMGAVAHLQAHCTHLEAVLIANNIALPPPAEDNLQKGATP